MSNQIEQIEIQEESSRGRTSPLTVGFIFAFLFVSLWNLYQIFVIQRTISPNARRFLIPGHPETSRLGVVVMAENVHPF